VGAAAILTRAARAALGVAAAMGLAWLAFLPLDPLSQLVFGAALVGAGLVTARMRSRFATLMICALTLFLASRYLAWRFTATLGFRSLFEWLFGCGLLLAECYTWLVLLLSVFQSARPLRRPVVALSAGGENAPFVDVYVPSYNEPLSVVETTVIAAMAMDYPADRFRVYLLDDGKRAEFEAFARRVGCGYLTRSDNRHAKAGNLNEAMKVTNGELICVLDCDHIPTRAFLQLTVGWFEGDPRLAIVQTPHFFYSPDPVQRNVSGAQDMPGEGDLFYDTIQSGNDLWNATFFCGSCAVIRRQALMDVGGFAFETVTEDAHTALKIQRLGWNTAFLNIRLSAGLATETLGQHIAQRARWCRGMTQILRIDNPLLGRGLTLGQRLCYLNSLLYYQFPLVRVAFLTSPLIYLLFGLNLIHAPAEQVFAYAMPYLVQSWVANQRLQGTQRRLFWGEIFETILAFHLVRPALLTWFSPKAGKFNVTDKGTTLKANYFDRDLVRPHLVAVALLVGGLIYATGRFLWSPDFAGSLSVLLLNAAWSGFNLVILMAAIAVARERRQIRASVRRPTVLPVSLYFADGRVIDAQTENVSTGGLAIRLPAGFSAQAREITHVDLHAAGGRTAFAVQQVALRGDDLRVRFLDLDPAQERRMVQALMARADAWQAEPAGAAKGDWVGGLGSVLGVGASTLRFFGTASVRRVRAGFRTAGVAAAGGLAFAALGHPARADGGPIAERIVPLAGAAPCRGAATVRIDLPQDAVVLSARLEAGAGHPPLRLKINGVAVAAGAQALDFDPAVLLPGPNTLTLSAPAGARCGEAPPLRLVLRIASLAAAAEPAAAPPPPAAAAPVVAPHAPVRSEPAPAQASVGWRAGRSLLLAALVMAACALLAQFAAQRMERQARSRLRGVPEYVR
jgi:cellulose synthase (UDP-forming)